MAGTMVKETIDFWKLEEFWNGYPTATFHMLAVPHVEPTYTWIIIGFGFAIRLLRYLPTSYIFTYTNVSSVSLARHRHQNRPLLGLLLRRLKCRDLTALCSRLRRGSVRGDVNTTFPVFSQISIGQMSE